ncbi:MAG: Dihydropteroate synthase (EC [uncultured Thiotrichaceae bacterium]|uniref:Dihydropteroate synthase n=1 Tax=uncultured Thiotrichaceae bacterium TaxID=298394 RepID=A0A6S6SE68_9GAMM|nr:MAG: Dihydropteroate synthase (EC [uncultured Thiotrichaceae bacterium]
MEVVSYVLLLINYSNITVMNKLVELRSEINVMGILNVTPDSFSDGGRFAVPDSALKRVESMIEEGAAIIDIGGESTRPGAADVSAEQELERVIPVLEGVKSRFDVLVSVDTSKAVVMSQAISSGVDMINDVRALQEEGALQACAASDVQVCLMHMLGQPRTMQKDPSYNDVVESVCEFFKQKLSACEGEGISMQRIWLDPGFGFGKALEHNITLLRRLNELNRFQLPLLIGISRKSMIGALLDERPVEGRLQGSVAAAVISAMNGARLLRVHDVKATVDALRIVKAVQEQ